MSNTMRAAITVGLVAAAVVLFVVLKDDSGDSDSTTTTATATATTATDTGGTTTAPLQIDIVNGKPAGGVQELTVKKGDQIRFTVNSDVADEVHLHGYDIGKDVKAGGSVSFDVPATIEGVFEAELEDSKTQILDLKVEPG
jgi:FtsP/CotA-like multicopper oxidase with cupredoxin domain